MLSHLLHLAGIDSVVVEVRSRAALESTIRAGVLEQGTVDLLVQSGVGERLLREGARHDGIALHFGGEAHRIDLAGLTGRSVWLYPQHEVLKDLVAARLAAGGRLELEVSGVALRDVVDAPVLSFTDQDGRPHELHCDLVVACDGSTGTARQVVPAGARTEHVRTYPYAWYGILAEAPPSSPELVYAHSPRGFALVSTRSPTVQRLYVQCAPDTRVDAFDDDQVWAELQSRVPGLVLRPGPVLDRTVVAMRSVVCEPLRHGRLFIAGDAGHVVPPTGAKGLNLAVADVRVLAEAIEVWSGSGRTDLLDAYSATALRRVWRAEHFSWWLTSMLHTDPGAGSFDLRRQLGELDLVTSSTAGSAYLAEAYTGWPHPLV